MLRARTLPEPYAYSVSLGEGAELLGTAGDKEMVIVDAAGGAAVLTREVAERLHTVLSARLGRPKLNLV